MTEMQTRSAPTKPRGRRATFDRDEGLGTALKLFWQQGYEGVSVAELCHAIGIAPPSLYHAFGSKADPYREAVRLYSSSKITAEDIASAPSARCAVQSMLERGVEAVTRPGGPVGCMLSSGMLAVGPDNLDLADEVRATRTDLRKALERRIVRDVEAGMLPDTIDPATLARYYATVLQGLSVQAIDGATSAELDAVVATAMRAWPTEPYC